MKTFSAVIAVVTVAFSAFAETIDLRNYNHIIKIKPAEGKMTTTLQDFPVLVRLSSERQPTFNYSDCASDGSDLRFSLDDGTVLAHEIDTWNPLGESTVWVKIPRFTSSTVFYVAWGVKDASVAPEVAATDVWSRFGGVWHLGEASGTCTNSAATGSKYDAVPVGNTDNSVLYTGGDAPVGGARTTASATDPNVLDNTNNDKGYLSIPNYDALGYGDTFTFSGWMREAYEHGDNFPRPFSRKNVYNESGWECQLNPNDNYLFAARGNEGDNIKNNLPNTAHGNWHYMTLVYSGSDLSIYCNGSLLVSGSIKAASDNGLSLSIGCNSNGSEKFFNGAFDECRLSGIAVDAAWVAVDYATQYDRDFLVYEDYEYGNFVTYQIPMQKLDDLDELTAGVCPRVTVSNLVLNIELALDTHYSVVYSDNTQFGTATVTITGKGEYKGIVKTVDFTISPDRFVAENLDLTNDIDWSGFESVSIPSGVVIDLKGHKLAVRGLEGEGEITDSVGGGELRSNVPAGIEISNSSVSLTGKLKFIKEGKGTFSAVKYPQSYSGGTLIVEGVLSYGCSDGNINSTNMQSPFGAASSEEIIPIVINPGGILDPKGSYGWDHHVITLNGGMISNTAHFKNHGNYGFNPKINLVADSTFATEDHFKWESPGIDLQGHTLTVWTKNGSERKLYACPLMTNGTLDVVMGGYFETWKKAVYTPTLDVRMFSALVMEKEWTIRDYTPTYDHNNAGCSAALNVLGTFYPESEYFYGPTMQDGSAIDLSSKTHQWSITSALVYRGNPTTKFASGAHIAILLGERTPELGEKLVSWTSDTKPDDSVVFTNATHVLVKKDDGLYFDTVRAFNPTLLPNVQHEDVAGGVEKYIASTLGVTDTEKGVALVLGSDYSYSYVIDDNLCVVTVEGEGDYAGMSVVRKFKIENLKLDRTAFYFSMEITPSAEKVTSTLTNFPVLVRLSTNITGFKYSQSLRDDLRFALPGGTMLAHEVDHWDAEGESLVWVKVPEFGPDTVIYAYWGLKPGCSSFKYSSGYVWPEYVGVWHLGEAGGTAFDSGVHDHHMEVCKDEINPTELKDDPECIAAEGRVGLGRHIPTKTALFHANKPSMNVGRTYTVSGWFCQTNTAASWFRIASKRYSHNDYEGGWYLQHVVNNNSLRCEFFRGNTTDRGYFHTPDKSVAIGTWYYIHAVQNDRLSIIYLNGERSVENYNGVFHSDSLYPLAFGTTGFAGFLDEMRYSRRALSDEEIAADYAQQTDADFLTYGKVESRAGFLLIVR